MSENKIFSGIKVVDLASFIAGPAAATILSDFGADVIKVEPPDGEPWRHGHKIPPQPYSDEPYPFELWLIRKQTWRCSQSGGGKAARRRAAGSRAVSQVGRRCSSSTRRMPRAKN